MHFMFEFGRQSQESRINSPVRRAHGLALRVGAGVLMALGVTQGAVAQESSRLQVGEGHLGYVLSYKDANGNVFKETMKEWWTQCGGKNPLATNPIEYPNNIRIQVVHDVTVDNSNLNDFFSENYRLDPVNPDMLPEPGYCGVPAKTTP